MAVIKQARPSKCLPKRLKLNLKVPSSQQTQRQTSTNLRAGTKWTRTRNRIISLPRETLDTIYSKLAHPRTQIAFTLTCRSFARIAAASTTALKPGFIARNGTTMLYDRDLLFQDLLRWKFVPAVPFAGQEAQPRLQLCRSCHEYLPTTNRIWYTRDGRKLASLKKIDWIFAVMSWTHGNGRKGLVCPTCQVPEGYDDTVPGMFLQTWDSGFAGEVLRTQEYGCKSERPDQK